jgi:Mor family transcriptional regulator
VASSPGSQNGRSKLTEENVRTIRKQYELFIHTEEPLTFVELADVYQVSEGTIRNIIHRRTWRHI